MKTKLLSICTIIIFILSACDPDTTQDKWTNTKLYKIAKNARSQATMQNHDKAIYGTWKSATNQNITLSFSSDSRWQYKKGTPNTAGSVFLSGNNFTMQNDILSLYKKDGEALIGKYKFNGQNNVTISDFSDNKFNGTWIKK